jgi:hypothetical protein
MENKPIGPCAKRESLLLSKMSGQRIRDKSTSGSAAVVHWTGRRRGRGRRRGTQIMQYLHLTTQLQTRSRVVNLNCHKYPRTQKMPVSFEASQICDFVSRTVHIFFSPRLMPPFSPEK